MKFRWWNKDHNRQALLLWAFSGHCETPRRLVAGCSQDTGNAEQTPGGGTRRRGHGGGGGAVPSIHQHLVTKVPTSVGIMSTLWEHVNTVWRVVWCDPMSRTQCHAETVTLWSAARWHPRYLRHGCAPAAPAALLNVERVEVRSRGDMYVSNARSAYRIEIIYNRNKITV